MGKSTISMAIFHCYVGSPEGKLAYLRFLFLLGSQPKSAQPEPSSPRPHALVTFVAGRMDRPWGFPQQTWINHGQNMDKTWTKHGKNMEKMGILDDFSTGMTLSIPPRHRQDLRASLKSPRRNSS